MECSVQGCIRHVFARGLCHSHYDADRRANGPHCGQDGCDKPQHAAGLCNAHYRAERAKRAPVCAVTGCGRAAISGGLCDPHRKRKERHGHLQTHRPEDWGARASHPLYDTWNWQRRGRKIAPEWSDFWIFVADVGVRPSAGHNLCRARPDEPIGPNNFEWRPRLVDMPATADRIAYRREYQRARRLKNPEKARKDRFVRQYGITAADYDGMHDEQDGRCAICAKPERSLNQNTHERRLMAVDHCHKSKKVRGLLCHRCNTALGSFEDDIDRLNSAIAYLERFRQDAE